MDESQLDALFENVTLHKTFQTLPDSPQPKYMDWCKELTQKSQHRASSSVTSTHGTAFSGTASPLPIIMRSPERRGLDRRAIPPQRPAAPDIWFLLISQSSEGRVPSELLNNMMEATKESYDQYERNQRDLANGAREMLINNRRNQQQQHLAAAAAAAAAATQSQRVDDTPAEGDGNNDDDDDDDDDDDRRRRNHHPPNHDDKSVEYDNQLKKEVRKLRSQFANQAIYYNEQNKLYQVAAREAQKYRAECSNASAAMTQLLNQIQMYEQDLEQAGNELGGGGGGGGEHGEGQALNGHQRRQRNRGRCGNGGRG
ncbi:hypothetical protein LY76DRAFT_651484 [Colletotrichum caudatum]|nr:hypothetical protein LY76DRAFT_651484 [Colletotrichum caudatum]